MAEVILDPTTRAPSPSWQMASRLVGSAAVAKMALWLTGYGILLSATDQIAIVTVVMAVAASVGVEARDRGWPILRTLLVIPLVLSLSGCVIFGTATPLKAWSVALTSYEAAAKSMTIYCANPMAERTPCVAAANATKPIDLVIISTKEKLKTGTIAEAELAAATSTLTAMMPLMVRAAGGR